MGTLRRATVATVLAASAIFVVAPADATSPSWAPAASATVHPGVQTISPSGQCTSNFVFTDGTDVFIGQAAHCTTTGGSTDTNGCTTDSLPLGTQVRIQGATNRGTLVYNSWLAMHGAHESTPIVCANNDFALVRIDPADRGKVNPTMPFWGGPTGLATESSTAERVYSCGNSGFWFGSDPLRKKTGISLGSSAARWNQVVYTVTPGVPGDSGSGFLDSEGQALGVLATLRPVGASNGVGMLSRELDYMHAHSSLTSVQLALGTEPFTPLA